MPVLKFKPDKNTTLKKLAIFNGIEEQKLLKTIKSGGVIVNKKRVKDADVKIKKGDIVSICIDENPPDFEFSKEWIVFEDDFLIVLNKPQGMTTQGTMCYDINHLYYFVKEYLKGYAGLHHRLDRDTSGLVLFTKKREVNKAVSDMFKNREIKKTYIAIVHGILKNEITINKPIGLIPHSSPKKWWVNMPQSKEAETLIKPLKIFDNFTLVEAMPLTGRTHQIRVHLASINHPIVGDKFYNQEEVLKLSLMLHCKKLDFNHPVYKKRVTIVSDTPLRFKEFEKERAK